MKRTFTLLFALAITVTPAAAQTIFVSPDVPTDPSLGSFFGPWDVLAQSAGVIAAGPVMTVPGDPAVDALHRMDKTDNWLFSIEAPSDLAGSLSTEAEPRDVIRNDAGNLTFFFCGGSVSPAIPLETNVDALYLDGGDSGELVVSFDVPTTLAGTTYFPSDLVRFKPTSSPPSCSDWALAGLVFDSGAAGVPSSDNVIAADAAGGRILVAMDVPSDLAPSAGPTTYVPGQIASWDGVTFDLFDTLTAWPLSSQVDALTCQANPGTVPVDMLVGKSTLTPGDLMLEWSSSCSQGAEDYGIYEGTIGVWYDHVLTDCSDDGGDRIEDVTPSGVANYYLVVAHNNKEEGSYGTDFISGINSERPQAANPGDRCVVPQTVAACP
jgi:hypothetical protein